MNKTLTIVIGVLVVIAAVAYFMAGSDSYTDDRSDDITQMDQSDTQGEADANVTTDTDADAANTAPAAPRSAVTLAPTETGMSVVVDSARLTQPGYIVIYRVNSQNDTKVIGNTDLLAADMYADVTVSLDSPIAKGQTIVAVLHADDGDGEFEFPGSDGYLNDASQSVYSDVDIVDVKAEDESAELKMNVEEFLMEEAEVN